MHITLGQAIWSSVKPILKIYLIIGTGFLLSKMNILTADATRSISDIVLTVLLPCLSFNKIVANIEDKDIKMVGIVCLSSVLIFGTGVFFAYVVRRFMPVPRQWYGGILAGGMFPNISDLPIAYLQTMDQGFIFTEEEGEKGVANVIIFLAMFLICLFNLGGFRLIEKDFQYNDEENAIQDGELLSNNSSSNGSSVSSSNNENEEVKNNSTYSSSIADHDNKEKKILNADNSSSIDPLEDQEKIEKPKTAYHTKLQSSNNIQNTPKIIVNNTINASSSTDNTTNFVDQRINNNNKNNDRTNSIHTTESLPASSILTECSIDSDASYQDNNMYDDSNNQNNNKFDNIARRTISQPVAYTSQSQANLKNRNYHHQRYHKENDEFSKFQNDIDRLEHLNTVRSIDHRDLPSQDIHDIIHEYSNVDQFGKRRKSSVGSDFSGGIQSISSSKNASTLQRIRSSNLTKILTSDATVSKQDIKESGSSLPKWIYKFPLTPFIIFFLKNCLRPCAMSVIIALIIAFIPWVKALFVTTATTPHIKQAPDGQPALSFIMDFTSYVGAASVPFGLLLLGATLGRLKIGKLYPGFWKSAVVLVFLRQCIMPIFGVLWCDRLVKAGWCTWENDKMLLFVIAISWALPTMTTLIYFTASYTPPGTETPIQMECVSFFLMIQYPLMVVSLPFLVSYFLKVQMKL